MMVDTSESLSFLTHAHTKEGTFEQMKKLFRHSNCCLIIYKIDLVLK